MNMLLKQTNKNLDQINLGQFIVHVDSAGTVLNTSGVEGSVVMNLPHQQSAGKGQFSEAKSPAKYPWITVSIITKYNLEVCYCSVVAEILLG